MALVGVASLAATPNAATAARAAMLAAGVGVQARLVEEPYLRATHGQAYVDDARRAGRVIPAIGRLR